MNKKIHLILIIVSILTPYIYTIFFTRTSSLFVFLPLALLSLIILYISTTEYSRAIDSKKKKYIVRFGALSAVVLYFVLYGFLIKTADYVFFKIREKRLNEFVVDIKAYKKIHTMTDGTRYWKYVNDSLVANTQAEVDSAHARVRKYYLDDILKKEQIDKATFEAFQQTLIDVDLIDFTTLPDGTISFTIDGMLDNCQGIAYSETGINPGTNNCGEIIHWQKLANNWYIWYTT